MEYSTKECPKCRKKIPESNFIVHEAQCRENPSIPQSSGQSSEAAPTSIFKPAQKLLPSAQNGTLANSQPMLEPRSSPYTYVFQPKTPASKSPPFAKPAPEPVEPIRCPKCTEYIAVESYEGHLQNCPNDYCLYCREPFPKIFLSEHKATCPQRSRQRPPNTRTQQQSRTMSRSPVTARTVTRRLIDAHNEEIRTVDRLPDGSQRITVETISPFGRQVSISTTPAQRPGPNLVDGSGLPMMGVESLADEFDPFEMLFLDHQRFMRLNRSTIRGRMVDLGGLLLILAGRVGLRQQGLRRENIDKIEKIKFKKNPQTKTGEEEKCPICISEFTENELLRKLPCGHMFHPECIDTWLVQNSNCPICKADMRQYM